MTASESNWFVRREQRQVGPLTFEQLEELARRGDLQPSDLIGNPARKTWIAAQRIPTLLSLISAAPKGAVAPDGPVAAPDSIAAPDSVAAQGIVASDGSAVSNDAAPNDAAPDAAASNDAAPDDAALNDSTEPPPLPQVPYLEVSLAPPLPPPPAEPFVPEQPVPEAPNLEASNPEAPSFGLPIPELPALDDWDTGEEIQQRNYFARHWRGELPLHVAFWFNGVAGFVLVTIVVALISASHAFKHEFAPTWMLASIIPAWLIVFAAMGWQVVGVWRSAGADQRRNKPDTWGLLAKAALAAAVLCTLFVFVTAGIPQLQEYQQIRAGDARAGKHTLQITREGRALEFSGGISFGAAKEFAQLLSSAQSVQTVYLNSDGGRTVEAERIAALIRARGLDTYVVERCASACTSIFLGGRNRLIAPSAKLGFHAPDFPGWTDADRARVAADEEAQLRKLGAGAAFAKRATSAPPSDMWYPSAAELLSEKIVTRVVSPADYTLPESGPAGPAPRELIFPR